LAGYSFAPIANSLGSGLQRAGGLPKPPKPPKPPSIGGAGLGLLKGIAPKPSVGQAGSAGTAAGGLSNPSVGTAGSGLLGLAGTLTKPVAA
jgi:hypothetical protein